MRITLAASVAAVSMFLAAAPASAHHSFSAEFDANNPIRLEGTVAKMEWVNPHAWIYLDVKKSDGTIEQWKIEGGTPNALFRRGFTKDSLKTGTAIVSFCTLFCPPRFTSVSRTNDATALSP